MYRFLFLFFLLLASGIDGSYADSGVADFQWKSNSVLSTGKWVKIRTSQKGIYKITYDKLTAWGFTSPELVNVYGNVGYKLSEYLDEIPPDDLVKNRSWRGTDGSGKNCLFFYSTGSVAWKWDATARIFRHIINPYSDECYYFLSQEGNAAFSVETAEVTAGEVTHTVTSYDDYVRYETEQYNLIKSGQQWYGERFSRATSRTFRITCENPEQDELAYFLISGAGRSSSVSSFDVTINQGKQAGIIFNSVIVENPTSTYADEKQRIYPLTLKTVNSDVTLAYTGANENQEAWLDYITVNWRRQLRMSGNELFFRDTRNLGVVNIARFNLENGSGGVKVLDITDPCAVFEVPATIQGSRLVFTRPASTLREYVAYLPAGNFPEPVYVGEVPNQNLHAAETPDMLIITHSDFIAKANTVADFHRTVDGMEVLVVTVSQVFNEFGSGSPDATAIRNFVRMFYDRSRKIKYVLLFGDGNYDNRNLTGTNKNFIPTFQSENSLVPTSSFVSDDYFVILDPGESVYNGLVDLGIGRLPVSTPYEAGIVTNKIVNYYSSESMGIWRTNLCFIGDDEDGSLHMSDSELLANQVNAIHREFQTEKIYFDAYPQQTTTGGQRYPDVVEAINRQVKKGVLILNYVGHANARYLADERVLDVSNINSWSNKNNLPIFVTATCEFSRFDADETSAGEYILLNPNGGGIGLFSTTRVVYAYSNYLLSKNFFQYAFEKDSAGENFRMGDIMRLAKINTSGSLNKRNFTLLADPALRLSYPKYRVVTKTINQKDALSTPDTLKALNTVTLTGEITDHFGRKLTDFNGQVTVVVYDKAVIRKTLGNSGETPFSYKVQNSVIYRGEATVSEGGFIISFVIPKDISYSLGNGKILYYAWDGEKDAHGAYENFIIGGTAETQMSDRQGPEINLYLDDPSFQNGDETSQNPILLAEVSDESGINTVGTGIGHDITVVLNGDYSNVIVLNDYYQAATDDFTKGSIRYPFRNLPVGEHSLLLKVWDVANNSSEAEVKFLVTSDFFISEAGNSPNPVSGFTDFTFTHNQPDAVFRTLIEIFDITGKRVDSFQTTVSSAGTKSNPLRWDLRERGVSLRNGLYLYRITIRSDQGQLTAKSGKMIIHR